MKRIQSYFLFLKILFTKPKETLMESSDTKTLLQYSVISICLLYFVQYFIYGGIKGFLQTLWVVGFVWFVIKSIVFTTALYLLFRWISLRWFKFQLQNFLYVFLKSFILALTLYTIVFACSYWKQSDFWFYLQRSVFALTMLWGYWFYFKNIEHPPIDFKKTFATFALLLTVPTLIQKYFKDHPTPYVTAFVNFNPAQADTTILGFDPPAPSNDPKRYEAFVKKVAGDDIRKQKAVWQEIRAFEAYLDDSISPEITDLMLVKAIKCLSLVFRNERNDDLDIDIQISDDLEKLIFNSFEKAKKYIVKGNLNTEQHPSNYKNSTEEINCE